LPGGGDRGAVDGRAGLDARGGVVSAGGMAHPGGQGAREDSGGDSLSREVALGAHVAATGARVRVSHHGRARRCRIRRQRHAASDIASPEAAIRARHLLDRDGLSWDTARRPARSSPTRPVQQQ
jgi:hypothetical protein